MARTQGLHPSGLHTVSGETRNIKVQKPGNAFGGCMTPLKTRVIANKPVATLPAVRASGKAAMSRCAKDDA